MKYSFLATSLLFLTTNTQDCDQSQIGVDLSECKLQFWFSRDQTTSPEDPLQMVYKSVTKQFPILNISSNRVIENEFFNLTAKTYHIDQEGFEPSIPSAVWVWEKGADVYINMSNMVHIDFENNNELLIDESSWGDAHRAANVHTHGLHISSTQDDTTREIHLNDFEVCEFNLPADHAGGLHWYHPHIEAVGELAITSGTVGGIVVEDADDGTEIPEEIAEIEAEVLLVTKMFPKKVVDLAAGYIAPLDFINGIYPRNITDDVTFKLEYNPDVDAVANLTDPNTNYTYVNGFYRPKYSLVSDQWYRFRMLFAGGNDEDLAMVDSKFHISKNSIMQENPEDSDFGVLNEQDMTCQTKLIAKDGVYLKESRDLNFSAGNKMWLTPANRVEFMIKCHIENPDQVSRLVDNSMALIMDIPTDLNRAGLNKGVQPIMQFEVTHSGRRHWRQLSGTLSFRSFFNESFDFQMKSCHPAYLPDMRGDDIEIAEHVSPNYSDATLDTIRPETLDGSFYNSTTKELSIEISPFTVNGDFFRGYFAEDKTKNVTVMEMQKVYAIRIVHGHHPLHVHINHMQLQGDLDDGSGYHLDGDFVDTLTSPCPESGCLNAEPRDPGEYAHLRTFIDRYPGRCVAHCHNSDHSDSLAFSEWFILPDDDYLATFVEPQWSESCSETMSILQL